MQKEEERHKDREAGILITLEEATEYVMRWMLDGEDLKGKPRLRLAIGFLVTYCFRHILEKDMK